MKVGYELTNQCRHVATGLNICKFISDYLTFHNMSMLCYTRNCLETFSSLGFQETTFSWLAFQLSQYSSTNFFFFLIFEASGYSYSRHPLTAGVNQNIIFAPFLHSLHRFLWASSVSPTLNLTLLSFFLEVNGITNHSCEK